MAIIHADDPVRAELRATFGFDGFRPLQDEVVRAILGGRDVFVLMPTGGGKSLCYQLPALLSERLAVVVSPLIALMKDQVDKLSAMGVAATFVNSSLDGAEVGRRQTAVMRGEVKLLYVAPERLMMPGFLQLLRSLGVAFFAVDEAHCISEWGHDFRPEYRELRRLRELFPETSLAAFTATATRRVQGDIGHQLGLREPALFRGTFNRPNLFYEVRTKRSAYDQLVAYLRERDGDAGIIYCQSRSGTDELAARLQRDGIGALAYHAGLEGEERRRRQDAFVDGEARIVVATIAFGMGIDKPDVRFVVHFDIPRNLEGYYQESGRAGRDGGPSDCIVFYSYGDAMKHEFFIRQKPPGGAQEAARWQLRRMTDWASGATCRRRTLLAYFDEQLGAQTGPCCDVCRDTSEERDRTLPAQMLLSCAIRTGESFGRAHLIAVLRGSRGERVLRFGHDRLSTYGIGREWSADEWGEIANELIRAGYVEQSGEFNTVQVTDRGREALRSREPITLKGKRRVAPPVAPTRRPDDERSDRAIAPSFKELAAAAPARPTDPALFERLRVLRRQIASERALPPYVIFHDTTLRQMAADLPTTREQLARVQGVGQRKLEDLGDLFLAEIRRHLDGMGAARSPSEAASLEGGSV